MGGDGEGVLKQAAFASMCLVGLYVIILFMQMFHGVMKPLVLAIMVMACLEGVVQTLEGAFDRCAKSVCLRTRGGRTRYLEEPLSEPAGSGEEPKVWFARLFAVTITLCFVVSAMVLFGWSLASSILSADIKAYQLGIHDLGDTINRFFNSTSGRGPAMDRVIVTVKDKSQAISDILPQVATELLSASSGFLGESIMFIIYLLMMLLIPVRQNKNVHFQNVFSIVRTYFALKAFCNACFSTLALILLTILKVDLAFIVAAVCFAVQFIPEVGAIVSLIMPVPIIMLNGRQPLADRAFSTILAVGGFILIKVLVSNFMESIIMSKIPSLAALKDAKGRALELQEDHPVIILFFALLMGIVWGAAGMLIAVPLISIMRLAYIVARMERKSA